MIRIFSSGVVNSSSIAALPPPASTWHWAQLLCRYERARAVRSCVLVVRDRPACGTSPAANGSSDDGTGASAGRASRVCWASSSLISFVVRPLRLQVLAQRVLRLVGPVELLEQAEVFQARASWFSFTPP